MRTLAGVVACAWMASLALADDYIPHAGSGPYDVEMSRGQWRDMSRYGREIVWKLYAPAEPQGPLPVVVFWQGVARSWGDAPYLGRHLASHGYAVFHIEYQRADPSILEGTQSNLSARSLSPRVILDRYGDASYIVDQIEEMARTIPWAGKLDPERIGVSGYDYGAKNALVAAGQDARGPNHQQAEPRFRAALVLSPSPPHTNVEQAYADMLIPIFHMTGTDDEDPYGRLRPTDRQIPFRTIGDVEQFLLVLDGAKHKTFLGRKSGRPEAKRRVDLIRMAGLAFWDAYLKGDVAAKAWLVGGGFAAELGDAGVLETKGTPVAPASH